MIEQHKIKPIREMTSSELFTEMTMKQRDEIYRMVWSDFIKDDVESYLEDEYDGSLPTDKNEIDAIIEYVANAFAYNGDYDCNLSYWKNIENLINEAKEI